MMGDPPHGSLFHSQPMHSLLFIKRIPLAARALIAALAVAAVLMLALPAPGRGRRARHAPPPKPAAPAGLTVALRPEAGPLRLTSLLVGREPRTLVPGRQVARSFITDDAESCHIVATARLTGPGSAVIHWSVVAPAGFMVPVEANWNGPRLEVTLQRPGGNPSGLGGPLSLTVQARALVNGQEVAAVDTVVQDELDQLRQEYVDLARRAVPDRSEFLDAATFTARYGRQYPWLRFEDLNWSVNGNTQTRYSYAIIRPELLQGLDQLRRAYGGIVINSGYRNPVHQVEVNMPVRESLHQYGYAADLAVIPGAGRALPNEADWRRLADAACSARAKWVEPLADSAPNSPGCHVHVDYRPGPASSAPVRLHGQVVDAGTGRPIAGALVLLGAMPARTDANGNFGLRNVLSGGPHPVEVQAAGYAPLDQPVRLVAWGSAFARLALHPAVAPLSIGVARVHWVDRKTGTLAVTLRVTNTGSAALSDARLSVASAGATMVAAEPTAPGSLPAGAVRGVTVIVRLRPAESTTAVPLAVTAAYRPASAPEAQTQAMLSVLPPGAPPPAPSRRIVKKPAARLPSVQPGVEQRPSVSVPPPSRTAVPELPATPEHTAEPAKTDGSVAHTPESGPAPTPPAAAKPAEAPAQPPASTPPPGHNGESAASKPTESLSPVPTETPKSASPEQTKPPATAAPTGAPPAATH